MDPLTAATIAAGVAWLSIAAVAYWPKLGWEVRGLRRVGAASIALLGLQMYGWVPAWAPLVVLVGGVAVAIRPRGAAAA